MTRVMGMSHQMQVSSLRKYLLKSKFANARGAYCILTLGSITP